MLRAAGLVSILAVGATAGCGGSDSPEPDAPDTNPPPFVPGPNLVTVTVAVQAPFYPSGASDYSSLDEGVNFP